MTDNDKKTLKLWRANLNADQTLLTITDHGAGSKKLGHKRKVAQIFKTSSSGKKYGKLLYSITKYYQPKYILELGTSLGTGALHMHLGNKNAKILSIEGCPQTAKKAVEHLHKIESSNIAVEVNLFEDAVRKIKSPLDLVFIDGHHDYNAMIKIVSLLMPKIHDETILIFDDIRWNSSMKKMWDYLTRHENFHLSIDLFRMGIIMKRTHQQKENFVIRY
jgi:predicted O-methyltransferase YrrM